MKLTTLTTFFIIDDDAPFLFSLKTLLKEAGIVDQCFTFSNGKEAMHLMNHLQLTSPSLSPTLILVDVNMPIMDGWEFVDNVKDYFENKPMPILMMTGKKYVRKQETNDLCLLEKPISFHEGKKQFISSITGYLQKFNSIE
ncbi:Response regulator receiver domain-containing protein [Pustulibacterium marinum]|uniref:Response regulator receiver domain-containing protein n=1 Tax=Pustulibacterium marinum TaxID=1224947 RepID=A0A1I7IN09_9FLAO|nr:response regulator [Pustulibacterium marinum]SFU74313.1 Response regulator receiver domain-containing protein [Pustulibacterium marinum]